MNEYNKTPEACSSVHEEGPGDFYALRFSQKEGFTSATYKGHPTEPKTLHQLLLDMGYEQYEAEDAFFPSDEMSASYIKLENPDDKDGECVFVRDDHPIFMPSRADLFALKLKMAACHPDGIG